MHNMTQKNHSESLEIGMNLNLDPLGSLPQSSAVGREMSQCSENTQVTYVNFAPKNWETQAGGVINPWQQGPAHVNRQASPLGPGTDTEGRAPGPAIASVTSMEMLFVTLLKPPALFPRSFKATAGKVKLKSDSVSS